MEANPDSRLTFDKFVLGACNQSAYEVALAVARNPGRYCNLLCICSAVGQGKTHLMVAVGHEMLTRDESKRVLFVTSEEFMNQVINAIRFDKVDGFHNRYRMLEVLLVAPCRFGFALISSLFQEGCLNKQRPCLAGRDQLEPLKRSN